MLTRTEIEIVQGDWEKVDAVGPAVGSTIYDRLLALDPRTRRLFGAHLDEQTVKLLRLIGAAVYGFSNPDILIPIFQALGRKHLHYGVRNEDYATLLSALLWTLRQHLGSAFGPDHEAAWIKAYTVLAEAMKPR